MVQQLILVTSNYPPEAGGPAKFAKNFSIWSSHHFDSVVVIASHPVENVQKKVEKTHIFLISRKQRIIIRYLKSIFTIKKTHTKQSVVIANGAFFEMFFASIFFGIEYFVKLPGDIVWEHARRHGETNLDLIQFQSSRLSMKNFILRKLFSLALRRARGVIVPSSKISDVCIGWGISRDKIRLIYNGVDTDSFHPDLNVRKKYDLITVCRLIEIKKVDELINLAHELNMTLLIVGDGHLKHQLQEQSRLLGNVATFHGVATQEELPALYNSAKFFVLNSEFEVGTPYALIEARSCGLVAIANALDGSSDVIQDGVDGFLFHRNTHKSLHDRLVNAANLGSSYEHFSKLARSNSINRFSELSVYSQIIKEIAPNHVI